MDKSEEQFFEMYDRVQDYLEFHPELTFNQVLSVRQVWDYAYACGKADGAEEIVATYKENN